MNAADEGTKATGDDNVNWWKGNEQEVWCKSDIPMNYTTEQKWKRKKEITREKIKTTREETRT